MEKLQVNYLVHNRYLVTRELDGGGQSFIFQGTDQKETDPEQMRVCIKQFEDLRPSSDEEKALIHHYAEFRKRLTNSGEYICLPRQVVLEYNSVIAIFPWLDGANLYDILEMRAASMLLRTLAAAPKPAAALPHRPVNAVVNRPIVAPPGRILVPPARPPVTTPRPPAVATPKPDRDAMGKLLAWGRREATWNRDRKRIAIALANAVERLHKAGIAHLDLSPHQVMEYLKDDNLNYIRLIDLDAAAVDNKRVRPDILGKNGYASPEHYYEQLFGPVGTYSDVFAMGIILIQLLLDKHPFAGQPDYGEAIRYGKFDVPAAPYHRAVIELLVACLSPKPAFRPTARMISRVLWNHRESNFMAPDPADAWPGQKGVRRFYVQIAGVDDNASFVRRYYESTNLVGNDFRGSGLSPLLPISLRLEFELAGVRLSRLNTRVMVKIDGSPLLNRRGLSIEGTQEMQVNLSKFQIRLVDY